MIKRGFEQAQFDVDIAENGRVGADMALGRPYSAIILDLMLPEMNGWEVCETLRDRRVQTPIIMLTARDAIDDRVRGLESGADDYLPKPFDLDELEARLRALHRRRASSPPAPEETRFGGLRWDRESGAIHCGDAVMELAPREAALLHALLARPGHAVPKERLFELVFPGEADVHYEAIEVVVYRLRKKLAHTGVKLVTLRGLGYLLKAGE